MRGLWHALAVAALTLLLFPLTATYLTGDVSRYLPQGTFPAGAEGKDQIVLVSAVVTLLVALVLAVIVWSAATVAWRRMRAMT